MGIENISFHLPHGKEEKMYLSNIEEDNFRDDGLCVPERDQMEGMKARHPTLTRAVVLGYDYSQNPSLLSLSRTTTKK